MAKTMFEDDLLGRLDSILEWSTPRIGSDLTECFEDEDEGRRYIFPSYVGKLE